MFTGTLLPHWGKENYKPCWWPSNIPFVNPNDNRTGNRPSVCTLEDIVGAFIDSRTGRTTMSRRMPGNTTARRETSVARGNRQRKTGGRRVRGTRTWQYRAGNGRPSQPPSLVSCSSHSSSDATMDSPSEDDEPVDNGLTRKDREVAAGLLSVSVNVACHDIVHCKTKASVKRIEHFTEQR